MNRINSPCQYCEMRYLGCHEQCARYKIYVNKKDEIKQAMKDAKMKEGEINEYRIIESARSKKKKGGKA